MRGVLKVCVCVCVCVCLGGHIFRWGEADVGFFFSGGGMYFFTQQMLTKIFFRLFNIMYIYVLLYGY